MFKATPRTRIAALLIGLIALTAPWSVVSAGSADDPEIRDGAGDISPFVFYYQLPPEAQAPAHAPLYDLVKAYVSDEDATGLYLRVQVADLPNSWILPAGAPGSPVPPIILDGDSIPVWDESLFEDQVQLVLHFEVATASGAKPYRAVATLAQLNLENPNAFPLIHTHQFLDDLVRVAKSHLNQTEQLVMGLPQFGLVDVLGQSIQGALAKAKENVTKARDAVYAECDGALQEHCGPDRCEDGPQQPSCQQGAYHQHLQSAFENATDAIDELNAIVAQKVTSQHVKSQVGDALDQAHAALDVARSHANVVSPFLPEAQWGSDQLQPGPPNTQAPKVVLFHRFDLYDAAGNATSLSGAIDLRGDFVQMQVPKSAIGGPRVGDKLTKFYAESTFKGHTMDLAPDPANADPAANPQDVLLGAIHGKVVALQYGRDYVFRVAPPITATSAPGGLSLTVVGPTSQQIAPGGTATYYVSLKNLGSTPLSGPIVLSSPAAGWSSQASQTQWSLTPGASEVMTVSVTGVAGGASSETTRLTVSISGGASQSKDFVTTMQSSGSGDGDGSGGDGGGKKSKKLIPGFEAFALAAALGAALVGLGRRRQE